MDWANERWVKLYTRNSVEWELLAWQARALLPLLMRRCDASGVIDFPSRVGATRSIAKYLDVPEDVVAAGLDDLESSETIEIRDCSLLLVNFVEAQEANATPAERQRRKRERAKRKPANTSVTRGHAESRGVTTRESREKEKTSTARVRARSNPHAETVGDSMDEAREEEPAAAPRQLPVIPLGVGEARACDGHLLGLDMVRREVEAQTGRRIGPLSRRMEHTLPGLQFALGELGGFEPVKAFVRWTATQAATEKIPDVYFRNMFKGDGLNARLEEWRKATEGAAARENRKREAALEVEEIKRREEEEERTDGAAVLERLAGETDAPFLRRGGG